MRVLHEGTDGESGVRPDFDVLVGEPANDVLEERFGEGGHALLESGDDLAESPDALSAILRRRSLGLQERKGT